MLSYLRFHHIGMAVFDIEVTARYYLDAGYSRTETVYDGQQNVFLCFLTKEGSPMLELIVPKDDASPVCKILDRNGVAPYHICYEVDDIDQAMSELRGVEFVPLGEPVEACAIDGRRVCFLYNKHVGEVELVESTGR